MKETLAQWDASPASRLTASKYLPGALTTPGPDNEPRIASHNVPPHLDDAAAKERFESIIDTVQLSGQEMGRDNLQRLVYIGAMGARFATVDSLHRAHELSGLMAKMDSLDIDINEQSPELKGAIIEDIDQLNALHERSDGKIDPDHLRAMIARVRRKAQATLAEDDAPNFRKDAATRLLTNLPDVDDEWANEHIYDPSAELLEAYAPYVRKKYADFLELVPEDKRTYTRFELKGLFESAKDIMADKWGLDNANEWTVQFGRTNVNVDMETKTIWIPEAYADVPRLKAEQLLVHELGGHLLRNLLGDKTGDVFYATSLPGRSADEESLLTALESTLSVSQKFYDTGIAYYMGVGLGLDSLKTGQKMPPDELQDVITDLALMNPNNTEVRGKQIGLSNTSRLVRGMPSVVIDGTLHQAINTDGLKYAHGQKHAVAWLEANRHNPEALDFVMSGKFAYSDAQQTTYGRRLYETKIAGKFAVPSAA
jgi:hypothetical protein